MFFWKMHQSVSQIEAINGWHATNYVAVLSKFKAMAFIIGTF